MYYFYHDIYQLPFTTGSGGCPLFLEYSSQQITFVQILTEWVSQYVSDCLRSDNNQLNQLKNEIYSFLNH